MEQELPQPACRALLVIGAGIHRVSELRQEDGHILIVISFKENVGILSKCGCGQQAAVTRSGLVTLSHTEMTDAFR